MSAQYVGINYDAKTIAAMAGAYGTEAAAESYYNEQVQDILKHYQTAEAAAAGIYASKFLDRKALTDLGIWASAEENYYYRRIYNMVTAKIMPKIWTVSGLMLKHPQNALYWGSYLVKTCDDTRNLCLQFESVVTNSRLSFKDVAFLELAPEVRALFDLAQMGGEDWRAVLDNLSSVGQSFTKDNLTADIDNLYNMGINLVGTGIGNAAASIMNGSSMSGVISGKAGDIMNVVEGSYSLVSSLQNNLGGTLVNLIGGQDSVANLFNLSNYNLTAWLSDYDQESLGRFYTQRWYIYRRDSGTEVLCDYNPPTDDDSVINGSHWTRFSTSDANFYPSPAQTEQILSNSESHAGWSRSKVQQLSNSNDGYTYNISYSRLGYIISRSGRQTKKAYAYSVYATRSWNRTEVAYEDVFDSYSMDLNTFKAQLNARLSELNDNEQGYTYYIGYDSRNYYQASDAAKLKGCETAIISVTCTDNVSLGEGTTQYKCSSCGSSLNNHSKTCVMKTTLDASDSFDTSGLDAEEHDAQQHAAMLQSQIDALEQENADLVKQIATASIEDAAVLRQKYNTNKSRISGLKAELDAWNKKLEDIAAAKAEASSGEDVQTDDYYRIPAIMQDCKTAYNLTWQGEGSWSGYTYIRKATMPNVKGEVTFKAELSIARRPKYFLGIKIHRAIMQISWSLTASYTDTEVVDMIDLDPEMEDAKKAQLVNARVSEIARAYPSCTVSTEYIKSSPQETDDTEDTYHLLWSSDRLEIAREIDSRITKIYADLVSLEKFMHYKLRIIDVWNAIGPHINDEQGRQAILSECHDRWMDNAEKAAQGDNFPEPEGQGDEPQPAQAPARSDTAQQADNDEEPEQ